MHLDGWRRRKLEVREKARHFLQPVERRAGSFGELAQLCIGQVAVRVLDPVKFLNNHWTCHNGSGLTIGPMNSCHRTQHDRNNQPEHRPGQCAPSLAARGKSHPFPAHVARFHLQNIHFFLKVTHLGQHRTVQPVQWRAPWPAPISPSHTFGIRCGERGCLVHLQDLSKHSNKSGQKDASTQMSHQCRSQQEGKEQFF